MHLLIVMSYLKQDWLCSSDNLAIYHFAKI